MKMIPTVDAVTFAQAVVLAQAVAAGEIPDAIVEPDTVPFAGGMRLTNVPANRFGVAFGSLWADHEQAAAAMLRWEALKRARRHPMLEPYVRADEVALELLQAAAEAPLAIGGDFQSCDLRLRADHLDRTPL